MKSIKVKFCNTDLNDPLSYGSTFLRILTKHYHVELSEDPEYLFTNESSSEYLDYDCTRIFYTGENIHPNFNLFDYAISFDYLVFEDRHFRLPVFHLAVFYRPYDIENAGDMDFKTPRRPFTKDDLAKKEGFCSFVYNNYLADNARGDFFKKLSTYKQVDSGGNYLNTTGTELTSKLDFDRKRKFAIAFENSSRSGYTTEKILTAFAADAIPIYYGDPRITEVFNPERFINCADYPDFDAVVARVKEIDQDDELYLEIINKPILMPGIDFAKDCKNFTEFLRHIIDQPLKDARRRKINPVRAIAYEQNERLTARYRNATLRIKQAISYLYAPFKHISFFEKIKVFLFRKLYTRS